MLNHFVLFNPIFYPCFLTTFTKLLSSLLPSIQRSLYLTTYFFMHSCIYQTLTISYYESSPVLDTRGPRMNKTWFLLAKDSLTVHRERYTGNQMVT